MSVSALFLLSSLVITAQGQQCSKPAGRQNMHLKDEYILKDTFESGSTVAFACDVGYTSAGGSGSIKCTAGIWSPVQLTCERMNCGPLDEVANGEVSYLQGTQFGDKVLITCNKGYKLVGKSEIACGSQGWLDRLPTCEVVKCLLPSGIANGIFGPQKEDYEYREVVEYSCNKGYTLNGSKQIICEENAEFKPSPPSCIWVECKDPVIPNAEYIDGSRPPHRHKATVIYNCKSGYRMIGQATLTCNMSSQWYPRIPECIMVECKDPVIPNAEYIDGSRPPHRHNATVIYNCKSGYRMIGQATLTCNISSQWYPRIPECISNGNAVVGGLLGGLADQPISLKGPD